MHVCILLYNMSGVVFDTSGIYPTGSSLLRSAPNAQKVIAREEIKSNNWILVEFMPCITARAVCLDVCAEARTFLPSLTNSLGISMSTHYQSNSLGFRLRRKVPARAVHGLRPPHGHQLGLFLFALEFRAHWQKPRKARSLMAIPHYGTIRLRSQVFR